MKKQEKSICQECGHEFILKKGSQKFCSRSCFKSSYYKRKKLEEQLHPFPVYICPHCGVSTTLDFNPIDFPQKWTDYACPACLVPRGSKLV